MYLVASSAPAPKVFNSDFTNVAESSALARNAIDKSLIGFNNLAASSGVEPNLISSVANFATSVAEFKEPAATALI